MIFYGDLINTSLDYVMIYKFKRIMNIFKHLDNHKTIFTKKLEYSVRYIYFQNFQDNKRIVITKSKRDFAIKIDDSENFNHQMINTHINRLIIINIRKVRFESDISFHYFI